MYKFRCITPSRSPHSRSTEIDIELNLRSDVDNLVVNSLIVYPGFDICWDCCPLADFFRTISSRDNR